MLGPAQLNLLYAMIQIAPLSAITFYYKKRFGFNPSQGRNDQQKKEPYICISIQHTTKELKLSIWTDTDFGQEKRLR